MYQDFGYGVWMHLKVPAFFIVVMLSVALCIAAYAKTFQRRAGPAVTKPVWEAIRDRQHVFSGISGWNQQTLDFIRDGEI